MTAPSQAHSVVQPSSISRRIAGAIVVAYALITMVPLAWIFLTGFKSGPDSIAYPPKVLFKPSAEGYCNLFTTRSRQTPEYIASLPAASGVCEWIVLVARPRFQGLSRAGSAIILATRTK